MAAAVNAEEFVAIIIGAGPAGLAAEAHIKRRYKEWEEKNSKKKKPRVVRQLKTIMFEKSDVTAPLWRKYTYENLTLQSERKYCQLPELDFNGSGDNYPTRDEFIKYLDDYVTMFETEPVFNTEVKNAEYKEDRKQWEIITTTASSTTLERKTTYYCDFLVVATGVNAEPIIPDDLPGLAKHFPPDTSVAGPADQPSPMKRIHAKDYKNGEIYRGKKVLVVGCGDSGIDICGDLKNYGAIPYIVVNGRDKKDLNIVNERTKKFYEAVVKRVDGNIDWSSETNLSELSKALNNYSKCEKGIINKECKIQVNFCSNIEYFDQRSVKVLDQDEKLEIDCVILATGYNHNVNDWLKGPKIVKFDEEGMLKFEHEVGKKIDRAIDEAESSTSRIGAMDEAIGAVGFHPREGLKAIKTHVKRVYLSLQEV